MLSNKIEILLKIFFISLFLFVCQHSWKKYRTQRTTTELRKNRMEKVQYPSVSICVQNAIKTYVDISNNSNLSFIETMNLIKENVWKRNEAFFFVNQASGNSSGFPCITLKDSFDPGRPCSFPFVYEREQYDSCSHIDNNEPWCFTKVDKNRAETENARTTWGRCSTNCTGEVFEPSNVFNLAREESKEQWISDMYDLRTYDDGFCHSFNPRGEHGLQFDFRLGFFLGHQSMSSRLKSRMKSFRKGLKKKSTNISEWREEKRYLRSISGSF